MRKRPALQISEFTPEERLQYHQERSARPMEELKTWIDKVFPTKLAEPNSKLGAGVKYMQKHSKGLTAFLRHPGAPLDNNILEQQLRIPVLNRKNFLFTAFENLRRPILIKKISNFIHGQ
ncbi:MAG: transposase [Bdellovibrionales bacterium]|nr:transposase [Bdellovibrionales bacterium]